MAVAPSWKKINLKGGLAKSYFDSLSNDFSISETENKIYSSFSYVSNHATHLNKSNVTG